MDYSKNIYYQQLFSKYLNNTCSKVELAELVDWVNNHPKEMKDFVEIQWNDDSKIEVDGERIFKTIMLQAKALEAVKSEKLEAETPVIPITKRRIKWLYAAAAAILLFIISGSIVYLIGSKKVNVIEEIAQENIKPLDILPGTNKAVLTLADGSTIVLDAANNGMLSKQGNTSVLKLNDGELSYQNKNATDTQVVYNTISIPRGGQYRVELADGTKVWLNAASSLRFPNIFSEKQRTVTLIGEGYFEVAKNDAQPFIVNSGSTKVQVLGTHFNVNTYKDGGKDIISLIEGSVKVMNSTQTSLLKPGQQAEFTATSSMSIATLSNIQSSIAWVNDYFIFENSSLSEAMTQLSRWYDIQVVYKGTFHTRLNGRFKRSINLSDALEIIKTATGLKFDIVGRNIIIRE